MDRIFMDEYYEHLRADNIEAFSKERNDEYVGRAEEYKAAKSALLEGLGLEHLFDHSHELTPKEKEIWMLFDRVDVAELLARDAFAKGAYMLGAEDREIMLNKKRPASAGLNYIESLSLKKPLKFLIILVEKTILK